MNFGDDGDYDKLHRLFFANFE